MKASWRPRKREQASESPSLLRALLRASTERHHSTLIQLTDEAFLRPLTNAPSLHSRALVV